MEGYQLWNALMYGVGVFVTCNVGGQILMRLMARAKPTRKDDSGNSVEVIRMSPEDMADFKEHLRRFHENRRQVDAGRADADANRDASSGEGVADADAGSDADAEESGGGEAHTDADAPTDGDSTPYGEGRYKLKAYGEGRYAGTA